MMVYLDNAATTSPKPASVVSAVNFALRKYSSNPGRSGHIMSQSCAEMIFNTRIKVAKLFNVGNAEQVVFTSNCTTALNIVINGLFKSGDHVIISSLEHNAVSRPIFALKAKGGEYDIACVSEYDDESTIHNFKSLIKPNTKAIICTHASNVFGIKLPIEKLGELCRSKGLIFIVDAAQTAGIIEVDYEKMNIDYLCVAPHKGLYAPMGTGILITDEKPNPLIFGGTGSQSIKQVQPEYPPERFESGTLNVPGIAGISAGIDFINSKGVNILNHEMHLITVVYDKFSRNKAIKLYTERPNLNRHVPVLSFNIKGKNSEAVAAMLNEKGFATRAGLHCAPIAHETMGTLKQGTVRICPSAFTTGAEIEQFIYAVNKISIM